MKLPLQIADLTKQHIYELQRDTTNKAKELQKETIQLEDLMRTVQTTQASFDNYVKKMRESILFLVQYDWQWYLDKHESLSNSGVFDTLYPERDTSKPRSIIMGPSTTMDRLKEWAVTALAEPVIEEGSTCPRTGCEGTLRIKTPDNCSCHVSPPCSACTENNILICDDCLKTFEATGSNHG